MHPLDTKWIDSLITDPALLKRKAVSRRKLFEEKSILPEVFDFHQADGWSFDKKLKKLMRIKREKLIDERLENKFWMLLFRMGYPEMSDGRNFSILIERNGAEPIRKQIDVFAKDEETVIVAECKASTSLARRSLQKDIEEFANLKRPITNAIKKHYGNSFKPKILWFFVTDNIIWSNNDKQRALGEKIDIITERELRYYSQIAEHLGRAARYQFLAEFLKGQSIPELRNKTVPAIKGKLGGRFFYTFVITPRHLLKISFVNHRSLNDPDGAPTYQRLVNRTRLRDIGKFIMNKGFFPNNILINFTDNVRFDRISHECISDVTYGSLYLPDSYRSAWIIDGQHRLYGFSSLPDHFLDQNIVVIAFVKMSKQEEANLFVTINHEQKSVAKHLLDDLEGELKWGSHIPAERIGAISARLINFLNTDIGEPFYNRITQQGMPTTHKTCLTVPAIKEAIKKSGLVGKTILNNYELGPLCGMTDSETLDRARSAFNHFFGVVRNAHMMQWESGRNGYTCTNVAIQAYIRLLSTLVKYWEQNTAADSREMPVEDFMIDIEEYLKPIIEFLEGSDEQKIKDNFTVPFGSGGPRDYYFRLCKIIRDRYSDFIPDGMEDWESEQSEEHISSADYKLKEIVSEMRKYIFDVFRKLFGDYKDAYWDKGITDKSIKADAYKRSLEYEVEERLPLETYLEIVEMKKIVESRQNWSIFKDAFNIPEPGEKGLAKNVKWMDRINELRRIPAHPARERHYKIDDFEYIDYIHSEFMKKINEAKNNLLETALLENANN